MSHYIPSAYSSSWRPAAALMGHVSAPLKRWLLDKGSLTERLLHRFTGEFSVEVLSERWGTASADEARVLGLGLRDRVLIREVLLYGGGQPCVYARSILPSSSLTGRLRVLTQLANKPLGAWLFKQPDLHRDPIEVADFSLPQSPLPPIIKSHSPGWGRRSVFYVDNRPILVAEIFLAPLQKAIEN
ncbi:MAG: chorismate lyase [Candidatus Pelagadaptatus aseana]|uniref:chorismate--pyruvate lyase family protein n=1 Tax=Candidatus Pelagadaptatus aseana TaxID=3120508 RepID=UPI0039B29E30